jgi:hypothetical protein
MQYMVSVIADTTADARSAGVGVVRSQPQRN